MAKTDEPDPWQDASDCCERGLAESRAKQFGAALASFERAAELAPEAPVVWNNVAEALAALHRGDEALAAFDRALSLEPALAASWFGKARLLFNLQRMEEALVSARKCVEVAADDDPLLSPAQMIVAFCEEDCPKP